MLNNFHEFEELLSFHLWIPVSGFLFPDSGFRIPDSGFRPPDSGLWISDCGFRIPDSGFRFSISGLRVLGLPATKRNRFLFLGHQGPIMVIDCDMHIDHYVFFMELDLISKIIFVWPEKAHKLQ